MVILAFWQFLMAPTKKDKGKVVSYIRILRESLFY